MKCLIPSCATIGRSLVVAIIALTGMLRAQAYQFTAVSESGTGYKEQAWFCSSELDQDKIKTNWDKEKRITSASYTDKGWFVVMAKNTGYTMQTYHYDSTWPSDWIEKKQKEGYRFTSIGHSQQKWMLVLSKGTGFTTQAWFYGSWSSVRDNIKSRWNDGYYITSLLWDGSGWFVVMSKGAKYNAQKYVWGNTYSEIRDEIKKQWDKGYFLQALDYGNGSYVALMVTYADGHKPKQSFVGASEGIKGTIKDWWDSGKDLVYVGGCDETRSTTYASNNSNNNTNNSSGSGNGKVYNYTATGKYSVETKANGQKRENLPDGGFRISYTNKDGSQTYYEEHPCYICKGDGKCHICWGTGGTLNGYTGIFYPCSGCARAGGINKCYACQGKGKTTLTGTYKDGVAKGYGNDGRMYIGTADGSNSRSSSRDRSSSSKSRSKSRDRSNDYVETIQYAPNYTGGDNTQWCEKCHKYAPAHSHIRKRVY